MDFKINVGQAHCALISLENAAIRKPKVTFSFKDANLGELSRTVETFHLLNINPYVAVVEDETCLHIYSIIDKKTHYRYDIPNRKFHFPEFLRIPISMPPGIGLDH